MAWRLVKIMWGRLATCGRLVIGQWIWTHYLTGRLSIGRRLTICPTLRVCPAFRRGQATVEYAIVAAGVLIPMTFGIIYAAQLLWIWHSVTDFTREGARYATTHCWQSDGGNILNYMKTHVPPMVDQQQFQSGPVEIDVSYFSRDPGSGALTPFSCDADCGTSCIPDTVTVQVRNYEFRGFVGYLGLPPVPIPDFQMSMPIESAGCDPDSGVCLP